MTVQEVWRILTGASSCLSGHGKVIVLFNSSWAILIRFFKFSTEALMPVVGASGRWNRMKNARFHLPLAPTTGIKFYSHLNGNTCHTCGGIYDEFSTAHIFLLIFISMIYFILFKVYQSKVLPKPSNQGIIPLVGELPSSKKVKKSKCNKSVNKNWTSCKRH